MASQIAFQDNLVIKIKSERDVPSSYCAESHGAVGVDSLKLRGRLASTDRFNHSRQQMIFGEETSPGKKMTA